MVKNLLSKIKLDRFVLAIILVVVLAYFFPGLGSRDSQVPLGTISSVGISLIFFFYGLKLSPEKIRTGLKNWKLHVLVQVSVFLFFPLIVLAFYPLMGSGSTENIWLGFLFMAALPSTVSSSVVMVSLAKGNVPAAIFNASISGLIGIVMTPLWLGVFLEQKAGDFSLMDVYVKLLTEILLPVILGLLLNRFLGKYAARYSSYLTLFDKSVILLIIYKSFVHSFEDEVFESVNFKTMVLIYIGVLAIFFFVYAVIGFLSNKLGFSREDKITARFCGTKKSLVHGTVFSKILFPASMPTGIILLPLILFHASQILIISFQATRLGKEVEENQIKSELG
ncbi:bile acid:sodium symporter family protein [Flagellimonas zhangzhouensis]|uniref:Solute carrier family 10 (Sodium/bile acid cotransporter), member 7 n=1 Tax=Flagellimonas zhangzhouensis TaxID=1073328 RepID=A0A1H2YCZ0_9FLAO|nr:bile acid:sodium symporter family protein [Allomuricauda zhangzhouensis]SDQ97139.1 solute carrier family 10 (sodium/bile acid cotransporter), member 7 [Allomuricauda zhangzhouensis]SDX02835.1 solute carrier family 10 (sodium/bile acid cotransporter), member 7 [Allomuricauda zhangzhouensis]